MSETVIHQSLSRSVRESAEAMSHKERYDSCKDGVILGEMEIVLRHQEVIFIVIIIIVTVREEKKEKSGQKTMLKRYKARGCSSPKTILIISETQLHHQVKHFQQQSSITSNQQPLSKCPSLREPTTFAPPCPSASLLISKPPTLLGVSSNSMPYTHLSYSSHRRDHN